MGHDGVGAGEQCISMLAPAAHPTPVPTPMFYWSLAQTNAIFTYALSFYRRDMASLNYSISILLVWRKMLTSLIWARSSEFGSYHLCEQRRFGRSCADRQNLSCSLKQAMSQEEPSDRKPDPWPLWMTGHEQLKFFMTRNARRHKFAWRGPYSCASVNNNKKCAIGRSENEQKSVLWGKMFIFVVAYMNMINDVGNLT